MEEGANMAVVPSREGTTIEIEEEKLGAQNDLPFFPDVHVYTERAKIMSGSGFIEIL